MKTNEIRDIKARNTAVRNALEKMVDEHGISYVAISEKVGMSKSSFSQWKTGVYDFGLVRLKKVETLIEKYENF